MYTEQYNEERHALSGVIIHDVRDRNRPLTIFAAEGSIGSAAGQHNFSMALKNGSIHLDGTAGEYRLIHFGEYLMTVGDPGQEGGFGRNEFDMSVAELRQQFNNPASPKTARLKAAAEYHSRFSFPFASLVFAVVAVPLGMQNRRSGKSAGYATSIGVLLTYYVVLSLLRSLAEKGTVPPMLALWLPNLIFLGLGWYLLRLASQERGPVIPGLAQLFIRKRKAV
jgi:lipopolysaccharide export system permease protein